MNISESGETLKLVCELIRVHATGRVDITPGAIEAACWLTHRAHKCIMAGPTEAQVRAAFTDRQDIR